MMQINKQVEDQLFIIWDKYVSQGEKTYDLKGREFENIDQERKSAIVVIKQIISDFEQGKLELAEFKTNLDSYNKQHNYWGFTAAKGQMFFNLLTKSSTDNSGEFIDLLKKVIKEPSSLADALAKMKLLYDYAKNMHVKAPDKRFVANPKSAAYFLSYFWQIHNNEQWPVMYSSLIVSFEKLEVWQSHDTAYENYQYFFELNESVKAILKQYTGRNISNWDIEHALWNFAGTVSINSKTPIPKKQQKGEIVSSSGTTSAFPTAIATAEIVIQPQALQAGFELSDYLIPKIARLFELGGNSEKSNASKGKDYERLVGEAFGFLDFDVEYLGQGTGREPDAIARYATEHIAFIIDAKAYSNGYSLGTDDRAIKEYINYYCPRLKREGFTKIGFIIVSNSFKSDLRDLIDNITWTTDVKRFLLLSTRALQYLVAYKTRDKISIGEIVDKLITFHKPVTEEMIIESFEDY